MIELTREQVALVDDEDYERIVSMGLWNTARGYAQRSIRQGKLRRGERMHRVILGVTDPKTHVDHINHNTLDNRKCNLRLATPRQNAMNRAAQRNNKSGHKGVSWHGQNNNWCARIMIDGKYTHLGSFAAQQDAINAYERASEEHFGEFKFKA